MSLPVAEEELVETLRYHGLELFGELKYGLVVGDAHLDVHQLADLERLSIVVEDETKYCADVLRDLDYVVPGPGLP